MMKIKFMHGLVLTLLALIFTIGLTFASLELPKMADSFLSQKFNFPSIETGQGAESEFKTGLYLEYYHLRLIGYVCFALLIILIILGFILNKSGLTSVGAVILFLPVFGQFALTMFFLGGLGFIRLIWLPFLDLSFDVFRLGNIVLLPYKIVGDLFALAGISIWKVLPVIITGAGLLLFLLGTFAWFYSRFRKQMVADFWVYRLSRHPQYLGWIIWSYGILFFQGPNIKKMFAISNSLPWLLTSMIIIGIAMLEELKMKREQGKMYDSYYRRTPFLFPLPRFISRVFSFPQRLIFKKDHFERKREIITVLAFYTVLCMGLSALYGGLIPLKKNQLPQQNIENLAMTLKESGNWAEKREAAGMLAEMGEPAVESLVRLLKDDDIHVRWYSADALGNVQSEKVIQPLLSLLYDEDRNVRRAAAGSLGRSGSSEAVRPLIEALHDQTRELTIAAARALGQIGAPEAMPALIEMLQNTNIDVAGAAAEALGQIGDQKAVLPLIQCLDEMENCPYNEVGQALRNLGSERSLDAFIAGLRYGTWWKRCASASALGQIKSEKSIEPLIEVLKDENEMVRRAAVLALMEIESEKTGEALTEALGDEDFEVRIYAKEALKRINKPEEP
jgi:HEAT repeat protein/protein-S-isoprenylcysteine O-methyltransferase Ste14